MLAFDSTCPPGTHPGAVRALTVGADGGLWIGTSAGLVRISSAALDQFDASVLQAHNPGSGFADEITCLRFTRDRSLWVGTNQGLFRFNNDRFSLVFAELAVSRIEESSNGHVLMVSSRRFLQWDDAQVVEHPELTSELGNRAGDFFDVLEFHSGARWYATGAGVARQAGHIIVRIQPYQPPGSGAYHVVEDWHGSMWIATGGGVFRAGQSNFGDLNS